MTVKEFKEKLNAFDENLEIGGTDWYGDILEIYDLTLDERRGSCDKNSNQLPPFVRLSMEYMGREPD